MEAFFYKDLATMWPLFQQRSCEIFVARVENIPLKQSSCEILPLITVRMFSWFCDKKSETFLNTELWVGIEFWAG